MVSRERREEIIALHTDPVWGSPYWIGRFRDEGLSVEAVLDDPGTGPSMTVDDLRRFPIAHFVPAAVLDRRDHLITTETSGFTGAPVSAVFTEREFHAGFVDPFLARAEETGFPVLRHWLWAGPSGPHAIGKAVRAILAAVGGLDPFAVDFDPRWYNRIPSGSLAKERYFRHIIDQVLALLTVQRIDVLFSTPPVLAFLGRELPAAVRERILGVHYGGMGMTVSEYREVRAAFPGAIHLSGYGNSLLGVFPEVGFGTEGIAYRTSSDHAVVEIVACENGAPSVCAVGETGRVRVSRYDESFLILNLLEADVATRTADGILNPHRPAAASRPGLIY